MLKNIYIYFEIVKNKKLFILCSISISKRNVLVSINIRNDYNNNNNIIIIKNKKIIIIIVIIP